MDTNLITQLLSVASKASDRDDVETAQLLRAAVVELINARELEQVCGEAYQVVGSMLEDLGQFETDRGTKVLDNLSIGRVVHEDVLPWPSLKPIPPSNADSKGIDDITIEQGWRDTFSTNNPYCPCDLKTFTKAVKWAERTLAKKMRTTAK